MSRFTFFGSSVQLPAAACQATALTRDKTAWQACHYITVQLTKAIVGLRVHTNGRAFLGREASAEGGCWLLVGDVIQTAWQVADSRSLPVEDPRSMVAFTHTSEAYVARGTVLNIGVASAKFGGGGGGIQAEYVSGPEIKFVLMTGKHWHSRAAQA